MSHTHNQWIAQTRTWIREVVIGLQFCPFAAQPFQQDRIRYMILEPSPLQTVLEAVIREAYHLDREPETETTLLILPNAYADFMDYLDMLNLCEQLLIDQGYEGIYQIASFHPQYQFADTQPDDAANYTNRSPHAMLHLIREESITRVLEHYPDPELIPERNRTLARQKGLVAMMALRQACLSGQ
ncbi:MAG: DUF1415 domain-containing protein [Saprospiraceae bacterium]|nr:DUF1415 domain-containing protein [Saprospiraceae bacterium]